MGKGAKTSKVPPECDGISAPIKKVKTAKAALEEAPKSVSLLHSWAEHAHDSFHDFSPEEARAIRRALVNWYEKYRRKLPWRGDPPPYNGSTAKNKNPVKSIDISQAKGERDIRAFFSPSKRDYVSFLKDHAEEENEAASAAEINGKPIEVTAYGVWVSEIMLQQTRVEAVIPYYLKWMEKFPTVHALAAASEEDVNAHWAGLGFYRRARLLHKGAMTVVKKFNGVVPSTVEELLTIDGIGRYTASAIASLAYNANVPVVDGNVCRVLARLRGIANHIKAPVLKDGMGWRLAQQLVTPLDEDDKGTFSAGDVNSAMMELGASLCSPSGTGIGSDDPLKEFYFSTQIGRDVGIHILQNSNIHSFNSASCKDFESKQLLDHFLSNSNSNTPGCKLCDSDGIATVLQKIAQDIQREQTRGLLDLDRFSCIGHSAFPMAPPKLKKREEILAVAAISFIDRNDEKWLMVKRPMKGLLAGQWEFPSKCLWTGNNRDDCRGEVTGGTTSVPTVDSSVVKNALDILLGEVMNRANVDDSLLRAILQCSRTCLCNHPIVHIFSHVRHTMWVEHRCITHDANIKQLLETSKLEWQESHERKIRLMTEKEMKSVGITAGVKKVLATIKKDRSRLRL